MFNRYAFGSVDRAQPGLVQILVHRVCVRLVCFVHLFCVVVGELLSERCYKRRNTSHNNQTKLKFQLLCLVIIISRIAECKCVSLGAVDNVVFALTVRSPCLEIYYIKVSAVARFCVRGARLYSVETTVEPSEKISFLEPR